MLLKLSDKNNWSLGRPCVGALVSPCFTNLADDPALLQARTGASCSVMWHQDLSFSSTTRFLHLLTFWPKDHYQPRQVLLYLSVCIFCFILFSEERSNQLTGSCAAQTYNGLLPFLSYPFFLQGCLQTLSPSEIQSSNQCLLRVLLEGEVTDKDQAMQLC